MDTSSVPLLNYGLQYQWCSDSDLSGVSSPETLSPVNSMDSGLSPSYRRPAQSASGSSFSPGLKSSSSSSPRSLPGRGRRSGGAGRVRSKQRESASEKEKLRMRDLTKALHHLRSYLPPSVAPAGQTLTKIETLRLAIRYISHLSAQLGLSEEALFRRRERGDASSSDASSSSSSSSSSPDIFGYFGAGQEAQLQGQSQNQSLYSPPPPCYAQSALMHPGSCGFGMDQFNKQFSEVPHARDLGMVTSSLHQSPPNTQPNCQMFGNDFCLPLVPREYWG